LLKRNVDGAGIQSCVNIPRRKLLEEVTDEICTEPQDLFDVFLGHVFPVFGLLPEELSDGKGN